MGFWVGFLSINSAICTKTVGRCWYDMNLWRHKSARLFRNPPKEALIPTIKITAWIESLCFQKAIIKTQIGGEESVSADWFIGFQLKLREFLESDSKRNVIQALQVLSSLYTMTMASQAEPSLSQRHLMLHCFSVGSCILPFANIFHLFSPNCPNRVPPSQPGVLPLWAGSLSIHCLPCSPVTGHTNTTISQEIWGRFYVH